MEVSYESIKGKMEQYGYWAEDELIWQTYINIQNIINDGQVGQKLHAICLEGPPGAGKTEYAEVYAKLLQDLVGEEVSLIDYQCDSTTGKADLYEEIRVAAAIVGNADEVIIAGKLVEAVDKANEGKKVILLLDEYDKAREETDAFLLKFLQGGKINTTQRGDVEILPENMQNLQVILCKNQMREELSGPLERRVKILRLQEMKPEVFYKVSRNELPNADLDVINAVTVLYGMIYENKDNFARMPSCSEGLLAIRDGCTLLKANAPEEFVYSAIISNMLKNTDDIETFKTLLGKDEKLSEFFKASCNLSKVSNMTELEEARRAILEQFFSNDIKRVSEDIARANRLLTKADDERSFLEERLNEQKDDIENKDIIIGRQREYIKKLLEEKNTAKGVSLFGNKTDSIEKILYELTNDINEPESKKVEIPPFMQVDKEHEFVKQEAIGGQILSLLGSDEGRMNLGKSIFEYQYGMLQKLGYTTIYTYKEGTSLEDIEKSEKANKGHINLGLAEMKANPMAELYDDGILLYNKDGIVLGATRVFEKVDRLGETGKEHTSVTQRYKFFTNRLVLPIYVLDTVSDFISNCYHELSTNNYAGTYIDCIVSTDQKKVTFMEDDNEKIRYFKCDSLNDNVCHITYENCRNSLNYVSRELTECIGTNEYDDYMRAELLKVANSRERQMIHTGKVHPKPTQYINQLCTQSERD